MVKYEMEGLEDFMAKLKDLRIDEVGIKVQLTGRDVQIKQLVRAKPEDAATEQVIPAKEAAATLYLTAVGFRKEMADTFEIPVVYSEQIESGAIISSQAEAEAFSKKVEDAKREAINALQEGFGKRIISGVILSTQHSNFKQGSV